MLGCGLHRFVFSGIRNWRQRIRNYLELCLGIRTIDEIKSDQEQYRRLCKL